MEKPIKRLGKVQKVKLIETIKNNNLSAEAAENYIQACGYSKSSAKKLVGEYFFTQNFEDELEKAQEALKDDFKIQKFQAEEISEEDYKAFIEGGKLFTVEELNSEILKYGYNKQVADSFCKAYVQAIKDMKSGKIKMPNEKVTLLEVAFPNIKPDTTKTVVSCSQVKDYPYKEWHGELDSGEFFVARLDKDGSWYYGFNEIQSRIMLDRWYYGGYIEEFLKEMNLEVPPGFIFE